MFYKKITFTTNSKENLEIFEKPKPALKTIPNWYKQTSFYINDEKGVDDFGDPNSTMKKCMPFFDVMTCGYHIHLPCDVWVQKSNHNGAVEFKWSMENLDLISQHYKSQYSLFPISNEYHDTVFKWIGQWIIETPKNYSCLFLHPTHHDDLPFKCISGLVDTDKNPTQIGFPFILKKDFTGLIPKGTPIIQVIPFKRDNFYSSFSSNYEKYELKWKKAKTVFFDRYKKFFRSKKTYDESKPSKCPFGFSK
jgi:hypothetical protein